jgi:lycopene cyclase-like protein
VKFAYLVGVFYYSVTWMVLFGLFREERNVIFWSSLACGPAGLISEYWHRADYWRPDLILSINIGKWTFGLEDYLFAFAFGGICTGIFELLMKGFWHAEEIKFDLKGFIKLFGIVLFSLMLMGALSRLFHLNSLYAISISFIIISGFIFYRRPTFIFAGLITALLMICCMWFFYWGFFLKVYPDVIGRWWLSNALSGITLAKVPIEELIWAGSAALFIGPAVRYSLYTPKCI